jgi:hypothetical protein
LGLALSEKQMPQVVEDIEKPKKQIKDLESSVALRSNWHKHRNRWCEIERTESSRFSSETGTFLGT